MEITQKSSRISFIPFVMDLDVDVLSYFTKTLYFVHCVGKHIMDSVHLYAL